MTDDIRRRGPGMRQGPWQGAMRERGHGRGGPHQGDWPNWPGFFGHEGHGGEQRRGPFGGHFGGPGGFGGHGFGGRERLHRGMLRYVILSVLRDGPKHGYEIIKHLEERTHGRYSPSPGTLYPTLQYLEDLGLVLSNQDEGRRVYQLTDAGRTELEGHPEVSEGFWSRFKEHMPSSAALHEVSFLKDALNDLTRTVSGSLRNAVYKDDAETIRRVRAAVERCQNDIREIIASAGPAQPESSDPGEPGKE